MARYEVVARVKTGRRLSDAEYVGLALTSNSLDKGLRFQRVEDLPDGMSNESGDREPRHPNPAPPHLKAARDLPKN